MGEGGPFMNPHVSALFRGSLWLPHPCPDSVYLMVHLLFSVARKNHPIKNQNSD